MHHAQRFLSFQLAVFGIASLVHAGILIQGYEHREAMIAEAVIAGVLAAGLVIGIAAPASARAAALGAQGFALLGTGVGIVTMIIGIGPRTALDVTLHAGMIALLVAGWIAVARGGRLARVE